MERVSFKYGETPESVITDRLSEGYLAAGTEPRVATIIDAFRKAPESFLMALEGLVAADRDDCVENCGAGVPYGGYAQLRLDWLNALRITEF